VCRGFCCYDTQDLDGAIDGNFLYLTFGDFSDDDKVCIQIGDEVLAALHRFGFKTEWDRSCQTRIRIKPFIWQKRFGGKDWTYEHAKELLSRNEIFVPCAIVKIEMVQPVLVNRTSE
jgi:hypothetical protein